MAVSVDKMQETTPDALLFSTTTREPGAVKAGPLDGSQQRAVTKTTLDSPRPTRRRKPRECTCSSIRDINQKYPFVQPSRPRDSTTSPAVALH